MLAKWRQVCVRKREPLFLTPCTIEILVTVCARACVCCVVAQRWVACRSLQQNPECWKQTSELWRVRSSSSNWVLCLSVWVLAPLCLPCYTPLCHRQDWWQVACSKACRHTFNNYLRAHRRLWLSLFRELQIPSRHCTSFRLCGSLSVFVFFCF